MNSIQTNIPFSSDSIWAFENDVLFLCSLRFSLILILSSSPPCDSPPVELLSPTSSTKRRDRRSFELQKEAAMFNVQIILANSDIATCPNIYILPRLAQTWTKLSELEIQSGFGSAESASRRCFNAHWLRPLWWKPQRVVTGYCVVVKVNIQHHEFLNKNWNNTGFCHLSVSKH